MTYTRTLAKRVLVDHEAGSLTIDGQEFPWYVAEDGPDVDRTDGRLGLTVMHVPVLIDPDGDVAEICSFDHDLEWIRAEGARHLAEALDDFRASCDGMVILSQGPRRSVLEQLKRLGRALAEPVVRRPLSHDIPLAPGGVVRARSGVPLFSERGYVL